jgi:hypothetical protein
MRMQKRLLVLAGCLLLAACGTRGGAWPSLMTPEEKAGGRAASVGNGVAPTPAIVAVSGDGEAASAVRAAQSRLSEEARSLESLKGRWGTQKSDLEKTLTGLSGTGPTDEGWSKAQRDLTRLNQIAAELEDMMSTVQRLAGTLAQAAARGAEVQAPLREAGGLLSRIEAEQRQMREAGEAVRVRLEPFRFGLRQP